MELVMSLRPKTVFWRELRQQYASNIFSTEQNRTMGHVFFPSCPVTRINVDMYVENECHCIAWSFRQEYLLATFGLRSKLAAREGKCDLHLWDISDGSIMTSYRFGWSLCT